MRSRKEIQQKLDELSKDERLSYPTATVDVNAPLALIQTSLEAQVGTLRWVLSEEKKNG